MAYELGESDDVRFLFLDGPVECEPARGIVEQFDGPYYRYFDRDAPHINQLRGLNRMLSTSTNTSPEDAAREILKGGLADLQSSRACDFVEHYLDQHVEEPFDGVLGFSEGASVAASLMFRRAAQGQNVFKFAIFICGLSAFASDKNAPILADETPLRIDVPTVHIIGGRDPARLPSLTLYNLCNPSLASIFDHGKGHTIPWGLSTSDMAKEIRGVIQRSRHGSSTDDKE